MNVSPAAGRPLVTARRWRQARACALGLALLAMAFAGIGPGGAARAAEAVTADGASLGPAAAFTALELAVLDRLNRREDEDPDRAGPARKRLADRLDALAGDPGADAAPGFGEARRRLESYWQGYQRILELRRVRDRLNEETLRAISVDFRQGMQRLMAASGTAEAGVAGDAVISMLLVQQHVDHLIGYHDNQAAGRARLELEAARHRIEELEQMQLDPGARVTVGEAGALLGSYATAFDQLVQTVETLETLVPDTIERAGDELASLLAATDQAASPAAAPSSIPSAFAPLARSLPAAPAPSVGDYRLPVVVTLVAVVAPLLGILIGWQLGSRRRPEPGPVAANPGLVELQAPPPPAPSPPPPPQPQPQPQPQPPSPAAQTAVVGTEAAPDWLVGMGRMVALLNTAGTEPAVLHDHVERGRAELVAARDRALATNRAMTGFLAGLGDHLEGPLSLIVRTGDQLMVELDRRGIHQLAANVELIQWSGEQLLRTIEGLRALAEIQAGTLAVTVEDFLVEHLIAEVRERLRPLTVLFGNRLIIQAAPGIGRMRSDFPKVRTALLHLMENACKFAENRDVLLVVMRGDEDGRACVRFTVTDTGVGIAHAHIDDIFEPFVGFGPARARGAGLGLALVHHYAVRLGGSVVVDSTPGRGSCFVLTLPAELEAEAESPALAAESPVLKLAGPAAEGG